jgi:rod shape-determining protein MreC
MKWQMNKIPPRSWRVLTVSLIVVGVLFLALGGYLGPVLRTVLTPLVSVQEWVSTRFMIVYQLITSPPEVTELIKQNTELKAQVDFLRSRLVEVEQKLSEAEVVYSLLEYARSRPTYKYVAASVIGRDTSPFVQYIIIDHGSDDGIQHGMPVVTQSGLVGRVDAVNSRAARIQLITDASSAVNVRIKSKEGDMVLGGSVTGDLTLGMIPQSITLQPGDLILTSGLGGSYPPDTIVGQIVSVRKLETDLFQTATVQPVVDFGNIRAVLVITNFSPVDISPLIPTPGP